MHLFTDKSSRATIVFLLLSKLTFAQNVGIGTTAPLQKLHVQGNSYISDSVSIGITSPKAILDIQGTTLLRGGNTNSFTVPVSAGVEFFTGRNSGGGISAGQTNPDIAFNFGGPGGGYKHFITTNHNSQGFSAGNAINFYVNNSFAPAQSSSPGNGNFLQFAVTAAGVGVGKGIPTAMLDVQGDAKISAKTTLNDSLVVNGGARFESNTIVNGNSTVNGNTTVNGNITVTGDVDMGYISIRENVDIPPNSLRTGKAECPIGTRLISGGGGINYLSYGQSSMNDIRIYYNGPSLIDTYTVWAVVAENTSNTTTRTIVVMCKCARLN
jgi:hypothetical protein